MKNNKIIYLIIIVMLTYLLTMNITYNKQMHQIKNNENIFVNNVISTIKNKYPNITKDEIINILNNKSNEKTLSDYNILNDDYALLNNEKEITKNKLTNNIIYLVFLVALVIILIINYYLNKNKIKKLTKQIENINKKNYQIIINDGREDELSILESEIYKTSILLKEAAENSYQDKLNIKESIENISHQLKTPLTSITIMLDNIIDNPNMDKETRLDFLNDINREITNINYLIQNILKLSRFDVNVIKYNNDNHDIDEIITKSINKLNPLCDLKNIKIDYQKNNFNIYCDLFWQVEAITNILKNAIEHSDKSSKIIIETTDNKVYSQIKIKDFGQGMTKEEQKNIFKRFYKGNKGSEDSVGIGLSLAKTIINKNNGVIEVDSKEGEYTCFTIKYYK